MHARAGRLMWVGLVVLLHPAAILYRAIARSYVLASFPGLLRLQFLIAFAKLEAATAWERSYVRPRAT